MLDPSNRPSLTALASGVSFCIANAALAVPAAAQGVTSQPVVQALPGPEADRLNAALLKLARRPSNLNALIEAGEASIAVGDLDAALGFYGRARELEGGNPKVSMGLANVYLRSGRPVEALPLFAEALSLGAKGADVVAAQALALDMVGDQAGAQAGYARALELDRDNPEVRRRLAISHAISGNRAAFEETLRPLVERRDFASFRARAFGLAILGEDARAGAIVDAVMPRNLAQRISPYLEFMPRLTAAQQAAAANLGIFPRAADIGRDSRMIAAYRPGQTAPVRVASTATETAGDRLEPAGEPLGPNSSDAAPERVADAFSDILGGDSEPETVSSSGAVDITTIDVPRETEPAKPRGPEHPRRVWVQLATGSDLTALAFDWRRIARKAPDVLGKFEAHTVRWGRANRLLAGPVENAREARRIINELNRMGVKTFAYTSPKGQEIQLLERR